MDQELVNFYRNRWLAVEQIEREEQQNSTLMMRWEKLNGLMRMARSLNLSDNLETPLDDEWRRWSELKQMVH